VTKIGRLILSFVLPPAAVLDKGCGAIFLVSILTLLGWVPGIVAALVLGFAYEPRRRMVTIPSLDREEESYVEPEYDYDGYGDYADRPRRDFIRLVDGELGEIIEDDGPTPDDFWDDDERRKRH
jgi:uncharacterized membrane protein YqaE (UPF0057 family)